MTVSGVGATPEPQKKQFDETKTENEKNKNESIFSKYDSNKDGTISVQEQVDNLDAALSEDDIIKTAVQKGFKISDVLGTAKQLLSDLNSNDKTSESRVESRIKGFIEFAKVHATSFLSGNRTAYTKGSEEQFYNDGYRYENGEHYTTQTPYLFYKDGETSVKAWIEEGNIVAKNVYDNKLHQTIEEHRDYDNDGIAEHIIYRKFDENGNEVQQDQDLNGDGKIDRRYVMEYDSNGNEISESVDLDMDGNFDKVKYKGEKN